MGLLASLVRMDLLASLVKMASKCALLASIVMLIIQDVRGDLAKAVEKRNDFTVYSHNKKVVCYWGTWANYRPDGGKFTPEHVDPTLCTHLIYSFAGLDNTTWAITSLDKWMDLEEDYGLAGFRKATDLKIQYPHLKVTIAIGGWNEGSEKYSEMAKDKKKRKAFVTGAVQFLIKHKFDGLDLDWEYPGKRGGKPGDKENFVYLIRELHSAFAKHKFLLTAAIGAAADTIDVAYDIPSMYKYLDYVHVMCYDYHGKWEPKTGHNAPLYVRPGEEGKDKFLNVDYTIAYLKKLGADMEKTVLGVPLYGRAFRLEDPDSNEMGAASKETSFQGPFTREDGFQGYNEICLERQSDEEFPWTTVWEEHHMAPYMYKGDRWVSYDNEKSLRLKVEFAYDLGMAGVMTWSIDTDDFRGSCGGAKFPLLRTLNNALYRREQGLYSGQGNAQTSLLALATSFILINIIK